MYPVHAVEEEGKAVWKWKASEWHEDGVTAHLDWMAVERYPVAPVANAGANYIWVDVKTELPANRVTMQVNDRATREWPELTGVLWGGCCCIGRSVAHSIASTAPHCASTECTRNPCARRV